MRLDPRTDVVASSQSDVETGGLKVETAPGIVTLAEVPLHAVDMQGALDRIDGFIAERTPHYNIAINAAKVVSYQTDAALRACIREAHLVTADGQAVVWAARALGQALPGRVAGADLMQELLGHAAEKGYSVYFFGARNEVVREVVAKARQHYPSLKVAGYRNGYFEREEETDIVAAIRAISPDILFLGFGSPTKEYFMNRHYRSLAVPFVMGVGGTFDVFAGRVKRAPRWMQRAGLEWFFRLAQEPRRMWKRYLVGNSRFIALVVRDLVARRSRARPRP
jgi:N-acetylglucosaminyldiphosphoundecaprenol N-acetyl-beta-D-mannosaminyltransferase